MIGILSTPLFVEVTSVKLTPMDSEEARHTLVEVRTRENAVGWHSCAKGYGTALGQLGGVVRSTSKKVLSVVRRLEWRSH